jgi:predicted metal-dependent hydrolase
MTEQIIALDSLNVPLAIRRSQRARRISLKIDTHAGVAVLVLPDGVSEQQGLRFAEKHRDWLASQWAAVPVPVPFADGAVVPLRGVDHTIRQDRAGRRGVVAVDGCDLVVSGRTEHLGRRLKDWLKAEARADIAAAAAIKAAVLGRKHGRITIRDQKTRWGSCAVNGNLAFNWRLILAPSYVLDYVVAHEIAHLAEHNHSPAFWRTVKHLTEHETKARNWLRREGAALHRFGS